jgi:hypothetical protein
MTSLSSLNLIKRMIGLIAIPKYSYRAYFQLYLFYHIWISLRDYNSFFFDKGLQLISLSLFCSVENERGVF